MRIQEIIYVQHVIHLVSFAQVHNQQIALNVIQEVFLKLLQTVLVTVKLDIMEMQVPLLYALCVMELGNKFYRN